MQSVRLFAVLLLCLQLAQGKPSASTNVIEADYEVEMNEFMDLLPDPDEQLPDEVGLRSDFSEGPEPDDVLAILQDDEHEGAQHGEWNKCDNDLSQSRGGIGKFLDLPFLKKIAQNLNPFANRQQLRMQFYLFKREFSQCGREIDFANAKKWTQSGYNASLPTRIMIHGWMSQSRGSFNRDLKDAYLKRGDYNVIVTDWSTNSANINYFSVVKLIESFGAQLVQFTRELNRKFQANYDDMYLIGHSLGAQIAGAAGKRLHPEQYNTIFALDPAGPKFRHRSTEFRIDATDAKYVESIHTSGNFGFLRPTGSATFYPNYGLYQRSCYYLGCSHIRSYQMFAESINSDRGFWGTPCTRNQNKWQCDQSQRQSAQMGGDPAKPKSGIYYVKTGSSDPFALGR